MRITKLLAVLILSLVSTAGFADSYFDFSTQGNIDKPDATFTNGGASITLWGVDGSGHKVALWYKNDGGDEEGIGLTNDPTGDHEISGTSFVQFTDAGLTSIKTNSVQSGEEWALYGSNTLGTLGTELDHGTGDVTVNLASLDSGYRYVSLYAPRANVLLGGAAAASVSEGSQVPMMATGLLVLFGAIYRKRFAPNV
jgi:hypothetical protein